MDVITALKLIIMLNFATPGQTDIEIPALPNCDEIRSQDEITCTACNIYHEARGESFQGQVAVAGVTRNRVDSDRFPDDFCEVVWQRKQFSWSHDGKSDQVRDERSWEQIYLLAYVTVKDYRSGQIHIPDNTHGSLWYHADYRNPVWTTNREPVAEIGRHKFYISVATADELKRLD